MPGHEVKRYIGKKTKKVAVLVSRGWGAGWSSWAAPGKAQEIAAFDHKIVKAVLDGNLEEAVRIAEAKIPGFYSGGAEGLEVEWLDPGQEFRITEYDGWEDILLKQDCKWHRA